MDQIADMLAYADFLVWASEVSRGWIEAEEAEELIDGYCLMYPETAEELISTSPALYAHYEEWCRAPVWD